MSTHKFPGLWLRGKAYWYKIRTGDIVQSGSLRTTDLATALERLEAQRLVLMAPPESNQIRKVMRQYTDARVKAGELEPRTVPEIHRHVERFIEESGLTRLSQITGGELQRVYERLQGAKCRTTQSLDEKKRRPQRRLSELTVQKYMNSVRGLLRWCVAQKKIAFNPADGVDGLKMKTQRVHYKSRYCNAEQTAAIFEACETDDLRFILFCGFHAGMRYGEIDAALPEWFDLKAGVISIAPNEFWKPKDKDPRHVPISKEFSSFLRDYGLREPYMLRPEKAPGKWRYRYDPRKAFKALVTKAGVPWVGFHTMRHSFASRLASAGVSIYKVAEWMGDDVRVVQKHYGHLQPDNGDIDKGLVADA